MWPDTAGISCQVPFQQSTGATSFISEMPVMLAMVRFAKIYLYIASVCLSA